MSVIEGVRYELYIYIYIYSRERGDRALVMPAGSDVLFLHMWKVISYTCSALLVCGWVYIFPWCGMLFQGRGPSVEGSTVVPHYKDTSEVKISPQTRHYFFNPKWLVCVRNNP